MAPHPAADVRSVARWYDGSMKVKTSVTLSPEILQQIDCEAGQSSSRSQFIEQVLAGYFRQQRREARDRKDGEIYARLALDPVHQRETEEVLELQAPWFELGRDEGDPIAKG